MMVEGEVRQDTCSVDTCKHRLVYDPEAGEWICCKCGQVFNEEQAIEVERRREQEKEERERERAEGEEGVEREGVVGVGGTVGAVGMGIIKPLSAVGLDPRGKTNYWLTGLGSDRHSEEERLKSHLSNVFSSLNIPFYMAMEIEYEVKSILKQKRKEEGGEVSNRTVACIVYSVIMKHIYSDNNILKRIKSEIELTQSQDVEDHIATVIAMRFNTTVEPVYSLPLLKVGGMWAMKRFYKR